MTEVMESIALSVPLGLKRVRHPAQIVYLCAIAHQMASSDRWSAVPQPFDQQALESRVTAILAGLQRWQEALSRPEVMPARAQESGVLLGNPDWMPLTLPLSALQSLRFSAQARGMIEVWVPPMAVNLWLAAVSQAEVVTRLCAIPLVEGRPLGRGAVSPKPSACLGGEAIAPAQIQAIASEHQIFALQHRHARCCTLLSQAEQLGWLCPSPETAARNSPSWQWVESPPWLRLDGISDLGQRVDSGLSSGLEFVPDTLPSVGAAPAMQVQPQDRVAAAATALIQQLFTLTEVATMAHLSSRWRQAIALEQALEAFDQKFQVWAQGHSDLERRYYMGLIQVSQRLLHQLLEVGLGIAAPISL